MTKLITLEEKDLSINMQLGEISFNKEDLESKVKEVEKRYNGLIISESDIANAKADRASLNKLKTAFDRKRIDTVNAFKKPTEQFESDLKAFASRIDSLRSNIDVQIKDYENRVKAEKESKVIEYFEELKNKNNLSFINYQQANINVTLSASLKSLYEAVDNFIFGINMDLNLINSQEHKDRIRVEYEKTLDVSRSIISVNEAVELERKLQSERETVQEEIKEEVKEIQTYEAPKIEAPEEIIEITFTVSDTKANIIKVREFMKNNNINYR